MHLPPVAGSRTGVPAALRSVIVVVLLVIGTIAALLTPPAVWGRDLVLDTGRYVHTLAPIARDPGMQAAIVDTVDARFVAHVDVRSLVANVLPPRAAVLAGPLQTAAAAFVHDVTTGFVSSREFGQTWDTMNRTTHAELVAVLSGRPGSSSLTGVQVRAGRIVLDLAPVVQAVKLRPVGAGLTVAAAVPVTGATIEIGRVEGLDQARAYAALLADLSLWLPSSRCRASSPRHCSPVVGDASWSSRRSWCPAACSCCRSSCASGVIWSREG